MILLLSILLAAALAETIFGIVKREKALIVVGVAVAMMCALGLILCIAYKDSIFITGSGVML